MNVHDFIRLREKDWKRLEGLIRQRQGRVRLKAVEVRELGDLYRAVTSDLAQARRDYPRHSVSTYLNQLLTKVHSYIYQQDVSDYRRTLRYFTHTIPQTFRQAGRFTLVAFLMFMVPALVGFWLAEGNPDVAEPLGLAAQRDQLANQSIWTNIPVEERPFASAFILSNNIRVALLAFGGGVLFGVFAAYILMYNGLFIGAVFGLAVHYGQGQALLDFVFAHGVVELNVIFMSGGAGLQLGWALLNPGLRSRRDALSEAGRRAVPLIVIMIPLLVMAGVIEGFVSPAELPFGVKVAVGLGSGALMFGYLLGLGHVAAPAATRQRRSLAG
ncbi:MAG: stage II sporulation protein M [Anaerolineae bacterium]|nr:stage II sporulation protein M [Anaerolineae bacterium]